MAAVSLYRSYRPQRFEDVVGQEHVVTALKRSVTTGQIGHAYLLCGTRGTGKTTLAKIFARAINCLQAEGAEPCNHCEICRSALEGSLLDIVEMDAASNNSVENIRRITEEVVFAPVVARYKVYIIDEVHMLSTGAFNALLKTLEEPPAHAVFILATTDPQRIPATILSRCQRYDLRALRPEEIAERLRFIATENQIPAQEDALDCLALLGRGSLRDAISLLDQCRVSFLDCFGREDVLRLVGMADDRSLGELVSQVLAGQLGEALLSLHHRLQQGQEVQRLGMEILQYLRDLLICKLLPQPEKLLPYPQQRMERQKQLAQTATVPRLQEMISVLAPLVQALRQAENPRLLLEATLIQLSDIREETKPPLPSPQEEPLQRGERPVAREDNPAPTSPPLPLSAPAGEKVEVTRPTRQQQEEREDPKAPETTALPPQPLETPTPPPVETFPMEELPPAPAGEAVEETKSAPISPTTQVEEKVEKKSEPQPEAPSSQGLDPELWPRTLRRLQEQGALVLYLLLRKSPVEIEGDQLVFHFTKERHSTYNEFKTQENQRILREALRLENRGEPVNLVLTFEDRNGLITRVADKDAAEDKNEKLDQLLQLAREWNIPITED